MSRSSLKLGFRRAFVVKPGGPQDVTRSKNVIARLDELADEVLLPEDLPALLVTNKLRGTPKQVQTLAARDVLQTKGVLSVGTTVFVANTASPVELEQGVRRAGKTYVVSRNDLLGVGQGFTAFVDGGDTLDTCRAEWAEDGTPEAAAATLPFWVSTGLLPAGAYPQGFTLKHRIGGQLYVFDTLRVVSTEEFSEGLPEPTLEDNLNYQPSSAPVTPTTLSLVVSVAVARELAAAGQVRPIRYLLERRTDAQGNELPRVTVLGIDATHFDLEGARQQRPDGSWQPGTFVLGAEGEGEFTPGDTGGGIGDVTQADLTANSTFDRNRANHTGTQAAATISDFATAADARINAALAPVLALIGSEGGDADAVVNTVREVLAAMNQFPEGVNLLARLAGVDGRLEELEGTQLTAAQQQQVAALASPFYGPDPADPSLLKGYTSLADALNDQAYTDGWLVLQSEAVAYLDAGVVLANVALYGRGQTVHFADGQPAVIDGPVALHNVSIASVGFTGTYGGFTEIHSGVFDGPLPAAGKLYNVDLGSAAVVGNGPITLYGSTTNPASVAPGVTVIDLRPKPDTLTELAYASFVALDFATAPAHTLELEGDVTFTATSNRADLRGKRIRLRNTTGGAVTLAYPSDWDELGAGLATSLAAGKTAILTLECYGPAESDVVAGLA